MTKQEERQGILKTKLDHLSFEWFFYNEKTTFASEVRIIRKKGHYV